MPLGGLVLPTTTQERLVLARSVGRRLMQQHGPALLAVGITGGTASLPRSVLPLRLTAVLASGEARRTVFLADGCKVELETGGKAELLATVGQVDLNWPLRGPVYDDVNVLLDQATHLNDLTKAAAQREAHEFGPAVGRAISGEVMDCGLVFLSAVDPLDARKVAGAYPPLAWALARLVALANRYVFDDASLWAQEVRQLPRTPHGWADFIDTMTKPTDLNHVVEAVRHTLDVLPNYAQSLGSKIVEGVP